MSSGQGEKPWLKRKNAFFEILRAKICCTGGSGITDVLITASIIILVFLPVFSAVMERYILLVKAQIIRDAVDVTNLSVYYSMETENLGRGYVYFNEEQLQKIYKNMLAENLCLDADLNPQEGSIADYRVEVESIMIYHDNPDCGEDYPAACPGGTVIVRPAVHSTIIVPVKPVFFAEIIKLLPGKEYAELKVHVDSDIPVNN
ncbi:MAG: hypothetical protein GX754_05730 [Clostridiaceae bacterium]|nr:hypothetical protein [Clostridiaceae bacterium]